MGFSFYCLTMSAGTTTDYSFTLITLPALPIAFPSSQWPVESSVCMCVTVCVTHMYMQTRCICKHAQINKEQSCSATAIPTQPPLGTDIDIY